MLLVVGVCLQNKFSLYRHGSGALNDGFLLITLKTLFWLPSVLLDLWKCIPKATQWNWQFCYFELIFYRKQGLGAPDASIRALKTSSSGRFRSPQRPDFTLGTRGFFSRAARNSVGRRPTSWCLRPKADLTETGNAHEKHLAPRVARFYLRPKLVLHRLQWFSFNCFVMFVFLQRWNKDVHLENISGLLFFKF